MTHSIDRRRFLAHTAAGIAGCSLLPRLSHAEPLPAADPLFKLSLAEWSLHKTLFAKKLDNLDFAKVGAAGVWH